MNAFIITLKVDSILLYSKFIKKISFKMVNISIMKNFLQKNNKNDEKTNVCQID